MSKNNPCIYVALPVLNEKENISHIIDLVLNQTYQNRKTFVCVNQPDIWWQSVDKIDICKANAETISILKEVKNPEIFIIDKSSPGKGWEGKKHGVGWARKTIFDEILKTADDNDIIVSLDADTTFGTGYFQTIADNFSLHPDAVALAVPYFHPPTYDINAYRAILRYEIYMRHYSLNMWRIGSPYTFTALGSAISCPVRACRAIGGMTPKMSGEDFYFLQKLRKYGRMLFWNSEKVYPAARFSDRVYFGTGPAMIKGNLGDWESYPIYPYRFFDEIHETYRLFPEFYNSTADTPVTRFISEIFCEDDPFEALRKNATSAERFVRACHEKFDGLRILQYVKRRNSEQPEKDEETLKSFILEFYGTDIYHEIIPEDLSFITSKLEKLEEIRSFLMEQEEKCQINSILF